MTAIIGFDTATEQTVVGATVGGEIAFEYRSTPDPGVRPAHSNELLPAIEQAVETVGGWGEVDLIGAGTGPGTYTGLRIAIATARGLALAGTARVVGVPTLEAMARSITNTIRETNAVVVPVLDAKRGEAFFGAWDAGGEELEPATVGPPSALVEVVSRLSDPIVVAGPGAVRFRSELVSGGLELTGEDDPANRLEGLAICEVAGRHAGQDRQESLEPIYLRAPDAERWTGISGADG